MQQWMKTQVYSACSLWPRFSSLHHLYVDSIRTVCRPASLPKEAELLWGRKWRYALAASSLALVYVQLKQKCFPPEDGLHADEEERKAELQEYYSKGSQYGVPASVILFQLAHSMQLGRSYLLWCAISY